MSDVEIFYKAISAKFPDALAWNELSPQHQIAFVQSINTILQVMQVRKA